MGTAQDSATILVVDDEQAVADAYALRLRTEYDEVLTAYGGDEALETIDERVDVALLDRRMPHTTGDEVLAAIRERELPCHVAMVTAVEPDFDIVEMGFDDYVVKPVDKDELFGLIEKLLAFEDIGPGAKAYYAQVTKKAALEGQKQATELADSPEYESLNDDIEAYGSMIVSMAEDAIAANHQEFLAADQAGVNVELQQWEDRLESMSPGDPLYEVAQERVEELSAELGAGDAVGQERFLEAVSDGFIAEGQWLDGTVQRALNLIFHNKDSEQFILDRQSIADLAAEGPSAKFDVSERVRELARAELNTVV